MEIKIKWIPRKQMTHENTYRDDTYLVHVQKCSYVSNQSNEVQRRAKSIRSLIFYYIFHVKPHFLKTLFDFDEIFTNRTSEARTYVIFCDYF